MVFSHITHPSLRLSFATPLFLHSIVVFLQSPIVFPWYIPDHTILFKSSPLDFPVIPPPHFGSYLVWSFQKFFSTSPSQWPESFFHSLHTHKYSDPYVNSGIINVSWSLVLFPLDMLFAFFILPSLPNMADPTFYTLYICRILLSMAQIYESCDFF